MAALASVFQMLIAVCVIQAIVVFGMARARARSGQRSPSTAPSALCAAAAVVAYAFPTTLLLTLAGAFLALTAIVAFVGESPRWTRPGGGRAGP